MTLTKALKLLNRIDKGKISHYLEDCIDYEERNLGVMRKGKVYAVAEFYVDEGGDSTDEAVPLIDCRFFTKNEKGEIATAELTAGDILAKDWECCFVDCNCDLNCTIREYLQDEFCTILYKDDIAQLNAQDLLKEGIEKIEIVNALNERTIRVCVLKNEIKKGLVLDFVALASNLEKDKPYIIVCYDKNGDNYDFERIIEW